MATDLNQVVLIGRLTRDLGSDERSFGYLPSGMARANVSIAVNRSRKNGDQWVDEVSYFDVTIWGKTAENLKPYLTKGKQIAVEGYLKQDRWDDKNTGQKMSKVVIVANTVQLLGGRSDGSSNVASANAGYANNGAPRAPSYSAPSSFQPVNNQNNFSQDSYGNTGSDFPEDIPF
jgi:single-strand DNA-binding protein